MRAGSSGDETPATSTPATTIDAADRSRATASALRTLNAPRSCSISSSSNTTNSVTPTPRRNRGPDRRALLAAARAAPRRCRRPAPCAALLRRALGDLTVAELTRSANRCSSPGCANAGRATLTSSARWARWAPLVGRAYKRGEVTLVPYIITGDLADSRPRERVLEIAELAAFWRAVDSARWPASPMLLLGTGARPGALADLTAGQIDILRRRIDLHPLGAPETGKRNPVLPIVPCWRVSEPRAPYVVERRMKSLRASWARANRRRSRPRRCALHDPPHARDLDV